MSQQDDVFDPMPEPPAEVTDNMCCGSGCEPCILDQYAADLREYRQQLAKWQARQPQAETPRKAN